MQYFLLLIVIVLVSLQNVIQKEYSMRDSDDRRFLFGAALSFAAMTFFIVSSGFNLDFKADFVGYSIGFAMSYAASNIGLLLAIKWGSLAITMLVNSYSLIIPTFYGIIFLNEKLSLSAIVGIVLLIISIFLIGAKKEEIKFSLKWLISLFFAFAGNGMCSTVQKMQQLAFNGEFKNEFMIISLFISTLILFGASLIFKEKIKKGSPMCIGFGACCGIANGIVNLLVMMLTALIPTAILFPSISGGGIVLGFVLAVFAYKEKLSMLQVIGYFIGMISVILLNI